MEELTGYGVKISFTLPSLANKNKNNLGNEKDEDTFTPNDEYMRCFARQSFNAVDVEISIDIIIHLFLALFSILYHKN